MDNAFCKKKRIAMFYKKLYNQPLKAIKVYKCVHMSKALNENNNDTLRSDKQVKK